MANAKKKNFGMTILFQERSRSRMSNYFIRISILLFFFSLFYFLFMALGSMEFFDSVAYRTLFSIIGRGFSFLLIKLGCSPGLSLAFAFFLKTLLTSEIQPRMMNPPSSSFFEGVSEELDHFCHCAEPEVTQPIQQAQGITQETAVPFRVSPSSPSSPSPSWFEGAEDFFKTILLEEPGEGSSAAPNPEPETKPKWIFDEVNARLKLVASKKANWEIPISTIKTLITLKEKVIYRMAELDPNYSAFWHEKKNELIAHSILTRKGYEFSVTTQLEKLEKDGINSAFFKDLEKLHPNIHNE